MYDNGARRYYPRPDHQATETLSDTDQIEGLVASLRKVDIGDIYFDGERGILAHRIRARSNLPQYQERNQEHFAVWRTRTDESASTLFGGAAADIRDLFERPEWAMPPNPEVDDGDYITYPRRVMELAKDVTLEDTKQSEISERLELIKVAADGSSELLNVGVPSFDHARQLLRLLSDTRGTILVGDLNKPDEIERLDPDVIITYDNDYEWLELLDSDTEEALESAKQSLKNKEQQAAMNNINEGLCRLHEEPTYDAEEELAALNRLLPTVTHTNNWRRPPDAAEKIDIETLPDPAQTILTAIRRLHNVYEFGNQQDRSMSQLLIGRRRGTDSPFACVAEELDARRESLRKTLYKRKAEGIAAKIDEAVAELKVTSEDEVTTRQWLLQEVSDGSRNHPEDSRVVLIGGGMVVGAVVVIILLGLVIPFFGIPLDTIIAQQATQPSSDVSRPAITMDSKVQDDTISVSGETTADRVTVQIANTSSQVLNTTTEVRGNQFAVDHPVSVQGSYTVITQAGGARAENEVLFDRPAQLTLRHPTWGKTVSIQESTSNTTGVVRVVGTTNVAHTHVSVRDLSNGSIVQSQAIRPTNNSFTARLNLTTGRYLVTVTADDRVGANTTVTRPVTVS